MSLTKTMVIPDMHFPYHDRAVWSCIKKVIRGEKPSTIVWIGDGFDFFAASSFSKNPLRRQSLRDEVREGQVEFDAVVRLGCDRMIYCEGNHEHRLERYLCERAPELYGMVSARGLVVRDWAGVEWVPYRKHVQVGKVLYSHDLGFAGVYAGRHTLQAAGTNIVFGHTHRGGTVFEGTHRGERRFSLNVGWGGGLDQVDYMHKVKTKDWQHGFGWLRTDDTSRLTWPQFVPIIRGRCEVGGRVYRA